MNDIERVKRVLGGYNHDPEHAELYQALRRTIEDAERYRKMSETTTEREEPAAVGVSPLEAVVSLPWRIDQDNDKGLCVVDARGEIVYVEDWGGIPDEMSSGMREQIRLGLANTGIKPRRETASA